MSNVSRRSAEVDAVFRRSLGAIHFALVGLYRLGEEEAGEVVENLYLWFERFSQRGSSQEMPAAALRYPLLVATCRVGLTVQLTRLDGKPCADPTLSMVLQRDPEDVAQELEMKLRLEDGR